MNQWISGNCGWQVVVSFSAWWAFTLTPFQWKTTITTRKKKEQIMLRFQCNLWFHICTACFNHSVADSRSFILETDFVPGAHLVVVLESPWWKHFWNTWTAFCFFRIMTLTLLLKQRHSKHIFTGRFTYRHLFWLFRSRRRFSGSFFQFTGVSSCLVVKQKHH